MDRRSFLKSSLGATGGLTFSLSFVSLSAASLGAVSAVSEAKASTEHYTTPLLEITPNDEILFTLARTEMGQGIDTGLVTALSEELEVNPTSVIIKHAPAHPQYNNTIFPFQMTGGSTSIRSDWKASAQAGANAREMLIAAAADVWKIDTQQCYAQLGEVKNQLNDDTLSYGKLSELAAKSKQIAASLKAKKDYKLIGQFNQRLRINEKVTGRAAYGIDTVVSDMLYAEVVHAPTIHGQVISFDDSQAKILKGIDSIFEINSGIAIVGNSIWTCKKASKLLKIKWRSRNNTVSSSTELKVALKKAADKKGKNVRKEGDVKKAFENSKQLFESEYHAPYLAHACMEPMNCTAHVKGKHAEIWAPNQSPDLALEAVHQSTGIAHNNININTTLMGGGFGRKVVPDFIAEAAEISKHLQKPIKLIWSREADIQNDYYRPASYHQVKLGLNDKGIESLEIKIIGPSPSVHLMPQMIATATPNWIPDLIKNGVGNLAGKAMGKFNLDESGAEGIADLTYPIPNLKVNYVYEDPLDLPIGFWRSVGHSHNAFVIESIIDEAAHWVQQDPYLMRKDLLKSDPRKQAVLIKAAEEAEWGTALPENHFHGIAVHKSFETYVAQVAEVSVNAGQIKVHKVTCAIDCGQVLNPLIVKQQMESGIIFGLTAALKGEISIADDKIQQSNFHDYQILRINESPDIEVFIIDSEEEPSGVGEPGTPPIAPAVANAVFAASKVRLRSLPLRIES